MGGNHTPGPWKPGKGGPNGCPTVGTERGLLICMMGHSINIPKQAGVANANATLIAASPDLLEALELADAHLTYICAMEGCEVDPEIQGEIDAAIAKAKGVQADERGV